MKKNLIEPDPQKYPIAHSIYEVGKTFLEGMEKLEQMREQIEQERFYYLLSIGFCKNSFYCGKNGTAQEYIYNPD